MFLHAQKPSLVNQLTVTAEFPISSNLILVPISDILTAIGEDLFSLTMSNTLVESAPVVITITAMEMTLIMSFIF